MGIDPGTLEIISLVAGGLQAGLGVIGSIKQGEAQKAQANYNASVAAANAQIAKNKAAMAGAAGTAQTEQASLETRAKVGGIVAAQAAGNIDINSGSALDVRSSAKQLGELNALTVRSNAARTAYGYQTEAASETGQESLYRSEARNAMPAAELNAFGNVLGGASSAASNYAKFQLESGNSLNSGGIYSSFDNPGTAGINWNQ